MIIISISYFYRSESIPFRVYQENGDYEVREEQGVTLFEIRSETNISKAFTVIALSFHALFEGLAVGLETESTDIWIMFIGSKYSIFGSNINSIRRIKTYL